MLTSRHAMEREKNTTVGVIAGEEVFSRNNKKWVKAVFLLGCYGCIFHGTGNSAQLCQNFGISGAGVEHPKPPRRYATAHCGCFLQFFNFVLSRYVLRYCLEWFSYGSSCHRCFGISFVFTFQLCCASGLRSLFLESYQLLSDNISVIGMCRVCCCCCCCGFIYI